MVLKIVKHIAVWLLIQIPLIFVGFVAVAIALLGRKKEDTHLPSWAWVWDNPVDGINGYTTVRSFVGDATSYKNRYMWLALRNPVNGLAIKLGLFLKPSAVLTHFEGDINTSDINNEGYLYQVIEQDGKEYFQLYYVKAYTAFKRPLCIRINIGYKIFQRRVMGRTQFVVSMSFWHPYKKLPG